jgi:hypothetical protein
MLGKTSLSFASPVNPFSEEVTSFFCFSSRTMKFLFFDSVIVGQYKSAVDKDQPFPTTVRQTPGRFRTTGHGEIAHVPSH